MVRFPDGNFTAILTVPGPGGGAASAVNSAAAAATAASKRACLEAAACWRSSSSRAIRAASTAAACGQRYQQNIVKKCWDNEARDLLLKLLLLPLPLKLFQPQHVGSHTLHVPGCSVRTLMSASRRRRCRRRVANAITVSSLIVLRLPQIQTFTSFAGSSTLYRTSRARCMREASVVFHVV